ncbi:MAG: hypothetical protein ABSF56_01060 [Minisyncoccia bacterium]|jgi:hypothetical protein
MDQNQQQAPPIGGATNERQPAPSGNGEKRVGPIIATLIIVLVLIIVALYLFASRINQPAVPEDNSTAAGNDNSGAVAADQSVQPVVGTSTDLDSLQNDLNKSTTGLDNQNF